MCSDLGTVLAGERTREQHHVVKRFQPVLGKVHQHRLFDKGLDVGAGLGQRIALAVEIEGHRMAVKGFGNSPAQVVLEMITQQLDGVLRGQRTEMEQRPIKRCWHREAGRQAPFCGLDLEAMNEVDHGVLTSVH